MWAMPKVLFEETIIMKTFQFMKVFITRYMSAFIVLKSNKNSYLQEWIFMFFIM